MMANFNVGGEDDFSSFLDLPNYGFDIPYESGIPTIDSMSENVQWPTTYESNRVVPQMATQMSTQMASYMPLQMNHQINRAPQLVSHRFAGPPIVPPTPNSLELQATATQLIQQMDPQSQQIFLERLRGMRDEQVRDLPFSWSCSELF